VLYDGFLFTNKKINIMKKQKTQIEKTLDLLGTASIIVFFTSVA